MKMRKLVSLVLALVMVLGIALPAMAAEQSAQETAGGRLLSLGVIEGYTDGTLGLDKTITRAEIAVVLARIAGMGEAADLLKDTPSKFSDVKTGEWYTGWINLASSQGWVVGDPQGTFRPNDSISYREIVTVLLKVLGYDDNLPGDWPTNFLAKAASLGITKGIVSDSKAPAVRGDVFVMTSRTLDEETVKYDKDTGKFEESGKTLLVDKMDLKKAEGVVISIPRVGSKKNHITIKDEGTFKVVGDVDFEAIFGCEVTAWLNADDEVVFVDIDSENIFYDALKINGDEITLVDADDDYEIELTSAGKAKATIYVNGEEFDDVFSDLDERTFSYAKVVLDDEGEVSFIDAYDLDDLLIVKEVDEDNIIGYGDNEIDAEDYTIVKDGKTIAISDLKDGDLFFYNASVGDGYAEVFNKSVKGEISRVYEDSMKVAGDDYDFDGVVYLDGDDVKDFDADVAKSMRDEGEVTVFVDRKGDAVLVLGDLGESVKTSFYAVLGAESKEYNDRGSIKQTLDVVNEKGEFVKYNVSQADLAEWLGDLTDGNENGLEDEIQAAMPLGSVLKVEVDEDNDVTDVVVLGKASGAKSYAAGASVVDIDEDEFKVTAKYAKGMKLTSSAVVFLAEDYTLTSKYDKDDNKLEVTTLGSVEFAKISDGYLFVNDKYEVVAIVVTESDRTTDTTEYMAVATKDSVKISGEKTWRLSLSIDGVKKDYETKKNKFNTLTVEEGDFLVVKIDDKTELITSIDSNATLDDAGRIVAEGLVSDVKTSGKTLKIDGTLYRLGSDSVVLDGTNKYNTISLSALKDDDLVTALLVEDSTTYVKYVVRTAKAGDTTPPPSKAEYGLTKSATDKNAIDVKIKNATGTFVVKIGDKAKTVEDGDTIVVTEAPFNLIVEGQIVTAQLYNIDDMDTALATITLIIEPIEPIES